MSGRLYASRVLKVTGIQEEANAIMNFEHQQQRASQYMTGGQMSHRVVRFTRTIGTGGCKLCSDFLRTQPQSCSTETFHGVFYTCKAAQLPWLELLRLSLAQGCLQETLVSKAAV